MSATVNKKTITIFVVVLIGAAFAQVYPTRPPPPPPPPTIPPPPPPPPSPLPPPTTRPTPPPTTRPTPPPPTAPPTYVLPDGAELIVGPIKSTFSCIDRIYGYYADTDNNCQVFHVCVPFVDEYDNQFPIIYSFFCGNQTVFDQANLNCAFEADATPCSEAPLLYSVNENFGRTDRPIVRE